MTDQARLKSTIYVGGLASMVDKSSLHAAFIPFGEIAEINLPKPEGPSSTEIHRGFGYIEFEDAEDAKEAIDNMDQAELFGRVMKVSAAKPQKKIGEGLGSKTALWEQEEYLAEYAVNEEDKMAADNAKMAAHDDAPEDPMQGLEGLDIAGPKPV